MPPVVLAVDRPVDVPSDGNAHKVPVGRDQIQHVEMARDIGQRFNHLFGQGKEFFTMPEALTEWKFMGFAHDRQLRSGLLTDSVVTAKDLMVQPNPPRFLREGDVIECFQVEKIARTLD